MVAASASAAAPAAFLAPSPVVQPLARPEPATPVATAFTAPMPALAPQPDFIAAVKADVRNPPDAMQWFVFGGTAAFLGVIWVAIWLVAGK